MSTATSKSILDSLFLVAELVKEERIEEMYLIGHSWKKTG